MRIAVFGAGGVGGYFGGRLAQAGNEVAFVARGAHLRAMRERGLAVESPAGDFVVDPARATDRPEEIGAVEAVLVCVKAWQVPEAGAALGPLLGTDTFVVPLQNGIEAADQLAAAVGAGRVVGGLCRLVSYVTAPGRVHHASTAPSIEIGERDRRPSARVAALEAAFAPAIGVRLTVSPDIEAAAWRKFLFIAPLSGVGALAATQIGAWRHDPAWRHMLRAAMEEIARLAEARGVALGEGAVEAALRAVDAQAEDATASMQRDLLAGRPSELEQQNGAVVRLARDAGVAVPVHEEIYARLLPLERRARAAAAR